MRHGPLLLGLLLPVAVHAGDIHRCVDRRGHVSLQSAPCAAHQRLTRRTTVEPGRADAAIEARNARIAAEMDRRNRANATQRAYSNADWSPRRATPSQQRTAGCAAARSHRDLVLRQVGLRRTFDLLRHLDDQVYRACR